MRRRLLEKLKAERRKRDVEIPIFHSTDIQFIEDEIIFNVESQLEKKEELPSWRQREAI